MLNNNQKKNLNDSRWTALDGLRGIMTCFVFLSHVNYDVFPGSIVYMDTFFIMSSFLITRLLLKDWERHGEIRFKEFYIRRMKRLFPALFVVVAATTAVTYFYWHRGIDQMLHVLAALFYFTNWIRAFDIPSDYYLGHTWSLSIEEQYYLLWPVILAACLKASWKEKGFNMLLIFVIVFTVIWRSYLALHGASVHRTYDGTDMRLDSLALGALIAINFKSDWLQAFSRIVARPLIMWLSVIVLLCSVFLVDFRETQWYVWQEVCFEFISVCLLLGFLQKPEGMMFKKIFQSRVAVYLGTICYGIYLWHYPILLAGEQIFHLDEWSRAFVCWLATVSLASLSYYILERPILQAGSGVKQHTPGNALV